ncbi:MAG: Rieske 2Fe-2S domain-containing protein [Candidatus Marinimicrobia bacterium]|nr:Rieske 2Fe-2S domain-containing protein [Candidatus Neomarinimicrobiota bacterium]
MKNPDRKKFLDIMLGAGATAWLASILYPISKYLIPPSVPDSNVTNVDVGSITEFPPNSSKIIRFGRKPVIVIRTKEGDFKALSATCTHLDCNVQYKTDTEQIWCACHNGFYNLEGTNLSGPPPKPLAQYNVRIANEKVIISSEDMS